MSKDSVISLTGEVLAGLEKLEAMRTVDRSEQGIPYASIGSTNQWKAVPTNERKLSANEQKAREKQAEAIERVRAEID